MNLDDWVKQRGKGELSRLARTTGLSYSTVFDTVYRKRPRTSYETAKRLSEATGGEVSIAEICERPEKPAEQPTAAERVS